MKDGKLDKVLEGFKPIPMKRLFYPRGMKLSEDFVNAFHREYDRLMSEGQNPRSLLERVNKAMRFHVNSPRKYKLLDEASEWKKKREAEKAELQKQGKERDAESAAYRAKRKVKRGNKVTINPLTDKVDEATMEYDSRSKTYFKPRKWSPLDGDRPKAGTPEGEEYETRHITPAPERERELKRRKAARDKKNR